MDNTKNLTEIIKPNNKFTDLTLRDTYNMVDTIHKSSPWYKDWHTYAYVFAGLASLFAISAIGMLGYSYISEYGVHLPNIKDKGPNTGPSNPTLSSENIGSIVNVIGKTSINLKEYIGIGVSSVIAAGNPYRWMSAISHLSTSLNEGGVTASQDMMITQKHSKVLYRKHYPFTVTNPNEPLLLRIKHLFIETRNEKEQRYCDLLDLYHHLGFAEKDAVRLANDRVGLFTDTSEHEMDEKLTSVHNTPANSRP